MDIISASGINEFLDSELKSKIKIDIHKSLESTNSQVKNLAKSGAAEGLVVISEEQTNGRGRLGRSFYSPGGGGIYMSVLLRPACTPQEATLITSAAAASVCRALELCGVNGSQIKWVNDIFLNDKKVCGILTEAGFGSGNTLDFAVLGVGINVYAPEQGFPNELGDIAGFAFDREQEDLRNRLIATFINTFFKYYGELSARKHIPFYRERCFVLGKDIFVIKGEEKIPARALDIDEDCSLLVEYENGEKGYVASGEISVRLK